MKEGKSHTKDTAGFFDKLKDLGEIPVVAILVTADVVGLYPIIPLYWKSRGSSQTVWQVSA